MDPSSVILASGFFLVSSVSLLLVNCRTSSAEKRQETSPSRKSVPVGSPSPTNGTSTSSNGKIITQQESHGKKKKSAFKSKKKKSQPRHSIPITVPPPRSFPLPVIKRANENKRNLKTTVPNTTSHNLKTVLPRDSDDEIVSDNKERETPAPSEHDEADTKLDFDVENTPSPVVIQNTEKVVEEVSEVVAEDDVIESERDEVVEKEDSTEVSASISSQSDIDEPTPTPTPSTTQTTLPPTPKNARKRKRRRRNRSTASTKVIQQSTKAPTPPGAQSDSQPQRTNHNRDHNQSHNHGGQIGTKISVTPAFDLDANSGSSCRSPLSPLVQSQLNTLMPDIGVHVEILKQPGKSQPNESSRNDVNPSPTRPPIKSKSHGSKLYTLDQPLSGSSDALSNLETKPLFISKDRQDLLSPPPTKSRAKPTKKPIVPAFRASTAPSTFSPSPYTDTDNESNTSGFESKTIHDSETSTRRRTPTAFKDTRDTLGTPPISLTEDEAFQHLDRESVMSTSMSRTTATSVSDLEYDPTPKHDDDWTENDGLEQQAELNRKKGIFPLAVPSEPSESPQPQYTSDDTQHQNRRRSKQKRSKHKQKKKSKSKSMPVTTTHTRISSETQTQATSVSPTIEKEPQMMMPQQFGQHLAHLQHVPRSSSQPDTSMVNISLLPQQLVGQVPMVAGRIPGPSMVPYPGAIDSNGIPQAPIYPAMNTIPPTFIPPTMIQPTLASQSYTDLSALAAHQAYMGLQGMGPLVRTQSAPALLDTSAMFPNMYYQQPLLQQQLLQMQAQMPGQLPAQIPTPIPPPMPISVPSSTPQDERSESSDQSHGKSKISRSKSDNSSLFLVQHPSGALTFENPQTYNPTDASAQRLSSGSPAATPSIANSATSDARSSSASQPIYQMPQIMPQMQHQLPMFSSPYYGSPYFNMQNQMLLSQQQQMMQIQTVPTGTTPNIDPNIRTFHENVLSAPLYQPTHQPTHVPSTTTNGTEVSVSGVPNPLLQQNLTSSNTDGS